MRITYTHLTRDSSGILTQERNVADATTRAASKIAEPNVRLKRTLPCGDVFWKSIGKS